MKQFLQKNKSAIKYLIAGSLAFFVDYAALMGCYYLFELSLWLSTSIGYLAGLCVSFYLSRKWVYGSSGSDRRAGRQLVEYVILLLINYVLTVLIVQLLGVIDVPPAVSKIGVAVAIVCWNYIIYSKIIFRSNPKD